MWRGVPSLIGVLLGVWAFAVRSAQDWGSLLPVLLLVAGWVLAEVGKVLLRDAPVVGAMCIECVALAQVGVVALITFGLLYLASIIPGALTSLGEPDTNAVKGAIVGAVSTYLANALGKDIEKGEGLLSPAARLRKALVATFLSGQFELAHTARAYAALESEYVPPASPASGDADADKSYTGWGFKARLGRVRVVRQAQHDGTLRRK